jgi:glycosyltransferase involved in cell wall biosynthesis
MANQTKQLQRLLSEEGAEVEVIQTNAPYRPAFVGKVPGVRAFVRLVPYLARLRSAARGVNLFHIMANSGWSWHFFAAPALRAAHRAGVPAVLNYRGGDAERFFARSFPAVERTLRTAASVVVPSEFLKDVFARHGVAADVVPNVIDLDRFRPGTVTNGRGPHVLVARHLEPIYDVETGLRAFHILRQRYPAAVLDVAGSGPERERLERLSRELGIESSVRFLGQVENERMPDLYQSAHVALNPSLVDNMPISILEALASGVPVVSTSSGGIPAMVKAGEEAVLVSPRDPQAMANAVVALWEEPERMAALREAGLRRASFFGWSSVREEWRRVYERATGRVPENSDAPGASGASPAGRKRLRLWREPRESGRPPRAKSEGSEPSDRRGEH